MGKMIEKRYGKKVDDVDDTIIDITDNGDDFAWFLSDDYTDEQVDKIVQRLNEQNEEKMYFLKVIFAMGNYAEKGDYERIINARDKVKQRILND